MRTARVRLTGAISVLAVSNPAGCQEGTTVAVGVGNRCGVALEVSVEAALLGAISTGATNVPDFAQTKSACSHEPLSYDGGVKDSAADLYASNRLLEAAVLRRAGLS